MTGLLLIMMLSQFPGAGREIIFNDDFDQPGTEWELGPWWTVIPAEGILQEYFSEVQTFIAYETDTAFSPAVSIPPSTDSIYVNIPYSYNVTLGVYGNNFWMYYYLKLLVYDENGLIYNSVLESYSGSGTPVDFYGDDECMILLPDGLWDPGDDITIALAGTAYCEHSSSSEPAGISIDWDIDSVTLTDCYCTEISRSTWASIKASF